MTLAPPPQIEQYTVITMPKCDASIQHKEIEVIDIAGFEKGDLSQPIAGGTGKAMYICVDGRWFEISGSEDPDVHKMIQRTLIRGMP